MSSSSPDSGSLVLENLFNLFFYQRYTLAHGEGLQESNSQVKWVTSLATDYFINNYSFFPFQNTGLIILIPYQNTDNTSTYMYSNISENFYKWCNNCGCSNKHKIAIHKFINIAYFLHGNENNLVMISIYKMEISIDLHYNITPAPNQYLTFLNLTASPSTNWSGVFPEGTIDSRIFPGRSRLYCSSSSGGM